MSGNKLLVNGQPWSRHCHMSVVKVGLGPVGLAHSACLGEGWPGKEEVRGFNLSDGSVHRAI